MDSLCLQAWIHGMGPSISLSGTLEARSSLSRVSALGRSSMIDNPRRKTSSTFSRFSFTYQLKSTRCGGRGRSNYKGMTIDGAMSVEHEDEGSLDSEEEEKRGPIDSEGRNINWILRILQARSLWRVDEPKIDCVCRDDEEKNDGGDECDNCKVVHVEYDENEIELDKDSFSRFLRRVSLAEARMYAQMSYLGCLAYCIPKIKTQNLLKNHGLQFITSSLEKRERAMKAGEAQLSADANEIRNDLEGSKEAMNIGHRISASAAYEIAVSAAAYLHSHGKSILPFKTSKPSGCSTESSQGTDHSVDRIDSVTAVVAAGEEVKQAVAEILNSTHSSPCEWYICDDDQTGTRFFVFQGSESLSSWQANLLLEPIQFEGLDVVVHRGIYEAAKGMYEQMLPEIHAHLESRKEGATLQFTGHSLGGSLAVLINLMLLIRREVPVSSLLPVITFGAPCIMCGGDLLLRRLGLPRNHVQAVIMHRDIVPRAFSCEYPKHIAELLKALNSSFRNHRCLIKQKQLFSPVGEVVILQPDEKFSPSHHLLPPGCGLYRIKCASSNPRGEKKLQAAQRTFLNSPHPLEILSDRSAYGSGGTIQRDHDMSSYLKSIRGVIRQKLWKREEIRHEIRRSLVASKRVGSNTKIGRPVASIEHIQNQINLPGFLRAGRESFQSFSRLVVSQHVHFFLILLLPARLLLLDAYSMVA